jgi:uncharacterized protein (DUF4415 family)
MVISYFIFTKLERAVSIAKQFVKAASKPEPEPIDLAPRVAAPDNEPRPEARKVGRPTSGKIVTTLRLDPEVIEALKSQGPGWQARANDLLRKAMKL